VLERWKAYQRDHDQIVALASDGRLGTAVDRLVGHRPRRRGLRLLLLRHRGEGRVPDGSGRKADFT
jgi:hypothetical protein